MVKRKLTSCPVDTKMPPVKKLKLSTQCSVSCKRKAFLAGKPQWRLQLHCHSFLKDKSPSLPFTPATLAPSRPDFSSFMATASPAFLGSSNGPGLLPLHYREPHVVDTAASPPLNSEIDILGIPIHKLSRSLQFAICVAGVMFFYLLYGYTQEWIFRDEGFKQFGWYLTLLQFAFYTLFGSFERRVRRETRRRIPIKTYLLLAVLTVSTMGLSNTSLGYLNYPTQVIFKSCKLIPVMIGGVLIQGKKYGFLDGMTLLLMSIGLILFTLADNTVQPNFDHTGVLLISLALCADAVIGNVQEKAMKQFSASNVEVVLFSYAIGLVYIFAGLALTGGLVPAFHYCLQHPQIYLLAAAFSVTGYLGINFVLVLVRSFGALLAVTVTTFRKSVTMVLSFILFSKPFTMQYVWSGGIVLLAILLNVYVKNRSKVDPWLSVKVKQCSHTLFAWRRPYYSSTKIHV